MTLALCASGALPNELLLDIEHLFGLKDSSWHPWAFVQFCSCASHFFSTPSASPHSMVWAHINWGWRFLMCFSSSSKDECANLLLLAVLIQWHLWHDIWVKPPSSQLQCWSSLLWLHCALLHTIILASWGSVILLCIQRTAVLHLASPNLTLACQTYFWTKNET